MANYTQAELEYAAKQIKNEVEESANTANRVGSAMLKIINYTAKSNDGQLRTKTIGFAASVNGGKVMRLSDGEVVFETQGNTNNRCGTIAVSAGDIVYISSYNIGSYEALPWAILDSNGGVIQSAGAHTTANADTDEYRIEVTQGGTLYVYMQSNYSIPTIEKVMSNDYEPERVQAALENAATMSQTAEVMTRRTASYLQNSTLLSGYAVDAVFSAGNTNNGVLSTPVTKGEIIKIVGASLGGYGNTYWSVINDEGIIQHATGSIQSVADDALFVVQASGTLYVSFGYYDSEAGRYITPQVYRVADLNERHNGVQASLKKIYRNTLLAEAANAVETGSKYISVSDGTIAISSAGNRNNGYITLNVSRGDYIKITGLASSSYSNIAWALCRADGIVLDYSGVIGYQTTCDDVELVAGEDAVLYATYGYYDEDAERYPHPQIYTIADAGAKIEEHDAKIDAIDKTLFRRYVAFEGVNAPMIVRYGTSETLKLDTSFGNDYNKCYYVSVSAGDRYLLKGASTGGYDGVAWAVFADGAAVQQSSEQTYANVAFDDELIDIEQDGILYVNNYTLRDDTHCELYKMEDDELDGNPKTKAIVIAGDSTAQGLASQFYAAMLKRPRRVYKMAVGSENVYATAARMGAIPLLCMPVTIPAEAEAVAVSVTPRPLFKQGYDNNGIPTTPAPQNEYVCPSFVRTEHFHCSIAGVAGDLYTTDGTTYFVRDTAGDAVTIATPVEVVPAKVERVRNSLLVCLMGTNGGYLNYDADYNADNSQWGSQTASQRAQNLFDVMKRMFAYMGGDMVVIGFFCGESQAYFTEAFYEEYESLCEHEFGDKFINTRLWLKDYAWQKMGLTLTDTDKTYMANGYPPVQLFDSGTAIHLSDAANAVFAQYVADRISNLGY